MNKKQIVRLTESDLHRIVKESVNRILKEASDSVSPQPFGRQEDGMYDVASDEEYGRGEELMRKTRPWRYNPNCKDLASTIEFGTHVCPSWFETGKYSIRNFLNDLNDLAHGHNILSNSI